MGFRMIQEWLCVFCASSIFAPAALLVLLLCCLGFDGSESPLSALPNMLVYIILFLFIYSVSPLLSFPLLSTPLLSSPHLYSPLLYAPFPSSPFLCFPLLFSPLLSSSFLSSPLLYFPVFLCPLLSTPLLFFSLLSSPPLSISPEYAVSSIWLFCFWSLICVLVFFLIN